MCQKNPTVSLVYLQVESMQKSCLPTHISQPCEVSCAYTNNQDLYSNAVIIHMLLSCSSEDSCVVSHSRCATGVQLLPAGAERRCGDEGKRQDADLLASGGNKEQWLRRWGAREQKKSPRDRRRHTDSIQTHPQGNQDCFVGRTRTHT